MQRGLNLWLFLDWLSDFLLLWIIYNANNRIVFVCVDNYVEVSDRYFYVACAYILDSGKFDHNVDIQKKYSRKRDNHF